MQKTRRCKGQKRSLVRSDLSRAGIAPNATVVKAQFVLKYYNRAQAGGTWVDRTIQAHRLLVDWDESQANRDYRKNGVAWSVVYGGVDGSDAQATPESSVLFTVGTPFPSYQRWDLTAPTRAWYAGTAANYGMLLLADNEDVAG